MTTYPLTSHPRQLSDLLADTSFGSPAGRPVRISRDDTLAWVLFAGARENETRPPGYISRHRSRPQRTRADHATRTRLIGAAITAAFAAVAVGFGLVLIMATGLPLLMCLPWICALLAGGMALTMTIALLAEPPACDHSKRERHDVHG